MAQCYMLGGMAKIEVSVRGDIDDVAGRIRDGIMRGSVSASFEDESVFRSAGGAACRVMVFERYSLMGANRVSMAVTLFQDSPGIVRVSGITSGGSQAVLFKVNTMGEEAFLDSLRNVLAGNP